LPSPKADNSGPKGHPAYPLGDSAKALLGSSMTGLSGTEKTETENKGHDTKDKQFQ